MLTNLSNLSGAAGAKADSEGVTKYDLTVQATLHVVGLLTP